MDATDLRRLARYQVFGFSVDRMNREANADLKARYAKAGLEEIMPPGDFDFRRDQFIPGRPNMIRNFDSIERHRGEVRAVRGRTVELEAGERFDTNLLLWGTGYAVDLDYLGIEALSRSRLTEITRRCNSAFRSVDAPNLFLLAPGVLESTTSTPWAYAHAAKSMMSEIRGRPVFEESPCEGFVNHFDMVRMLARFDRAHYPPLVWYLKYLWLALLHPKSKPMPLP